MTVPRTSAARTRRGTALLAALALAPMLCATGCQGTKTSSATDSGTPIQVVAAEGIWGDIAGQIGGTQVNVTTIMGSAAGDPSSYEPTAANTSAIASAQVFILTGAGLDPWASEAAGSEPGIGRLDVNVGDEVGIAPGGDPYLWYNPDFVQTAAEQIEADFAKLRPDQATYFQAQEQSFLQSGLTADESMISNIMTKYRGTRVGVCTALGSELAAQLEFRSDDPVTAAEIAGRQVKLLLCDAQQIDPATQALLGAAAQAKVPVVMLSENVEPSGITYQQWLSQQLQTLEQALS